MRISDWSSDVCSSDLDWLDAAASEEGVYLPGLAKGEALHHARRRGFSVDAELWAQVKALGRRRWAEAAASSPLRSSPAGLTRGSRASDGTVALDCRVKPGNGDGRAAGRGREWQ